MGSSDNRQFSCWITCRNPRTVSSMISATVLTSCTRAALSPAGPAARVVSPAMYTRSIRSEAAEGSSTLLTVSGRRRVRRLALGGNGARLVARAGAATIAALKLGCTGDSWDATNRVPIATPSAPNAKAAAIPRPSTIPPAAIKGRETCSLTSWSRTKLCISSSLRMPALSAPSTTRPSTPASAAFRAARKDGTA